ncbi:hypothetical protein COT64_00145 [Candidatus Shapirobacteria bacterium CG09_land_8_20_14_0_10_39_12]|uniref:Peptidase E n=1 Tax=Candidatus Shapirobacteria bacterium CG09_land_8_20_14_0_10_39_12 TaxID=1974885 RepID=A0A2H0WQI8_9BACT|nr:MAG: hypothetical protein COT64_00145 [Candidatus Shapirobacteria bacterium CG09_land_8_20_14_0_10_39_12]
MNIIYGGGYNKLSEESIKASFINTYYPYIKRFKENVKKVAFVTLAKSDGYYDKLIFPLYSNLVDVIGFSNLKNVVWTSYDALFLFGGNATSLLNGLKESKFDLDGLKKDAIVLGDSAGSYVLSSYFYDSPLGDLRGLQIEFVEGLNSKAKVITIAHKNNPTYCNDTLIEKVNNFAREKSINVLFLEENEQKLLKDGDFVDFNKEHLFQVNQ